MAEELAQWRRSRAGQRGAVTRKAGEAETLLAEADPDLVRLAQIKTTLEEKRDNLRTFDEAIAGSSELSEEDLIDDICQADKVREDIGVLVQGTGIDLIAWGKGCNTSEWGRIYPAFTQGWKNYPAPCGAINDVKAQGQVT